MKELKRYQINVYRKTSTDEIIVFHANTNWTVEDPEQFARDCGGDRIEIVELEPRQIETPWPPKRPRR